LGPSLLAYARAILFAILVWPARQLVVQSLLLGYPLRLRGGRLDQAIAAKHDVGAAAIEAATYTSAAALIVAL
jgi:hypothetical protein